jgi:hypothetical protein
MKSRGYLAGAAGATLLLAGGPALAQEAATLPEAIAGGKLILEVRARYEGVDQANIAASADALTIRTRVGWETAPWKGLRGLIEFEDIRALSDDYNDGVPPAEPFPVVADPEVTELNRLQLAWTPTKAFGATVGRQRVNLDDQRFVGAVGWRQDEQTLDAVRADVSTGRFRATAAYVTQVNRVFGEALDFDSESILVNASFAASDLFTPTAFLYALDFPNAPALSTETLGVRVVGKAKVGAVGLSWAASVATQEPNGANPGAFDLDYAQAELSGALGPVTLRAAYEVLEGDGVRGFSTPLATLHAFNGWADVFLTTPAAGLEDLDLGVTWRLPWKSAYLSNVVLTARWHDYEAELTGLDLGEEWNLQATAPVTPRVSAIAKYADYDGVAGLPSREKLWLGLEFKL